MGKEDIKYVTHHTQEINCKQKENELTNHNSTAFGVNSKVLPRDDSSAATLPVRFLVDFLKHILGRIVLQDDNTARVGTNNDVI